MKKFFATLLLVLLIPASSFAQGTPIPTDPGNPLPLPPWQTPNQGTDTPNFDDQGPTQVLWGPYYEDGEWGAYGPDFGEGEKQDPNYTNNYFKSATSCPHTFKNAKNFSGIVYAIVCLVQVYLIPILVMVGFVIFLYSGIQFIQNAENEEKRSEYKHGLIWGIIILFVMFSFWGIILLLRKTFGI